MTLAQNRQASRYVRSSITHRNRSWSTSGARIAAVLDGTGPARLLDMVEGRSKPVFKAWLDARPAEWKDKIEVVAMDGFTGFKTATAEEVPDATAVMGPFHAVRLAGDALDECRRRVQQQLHAHRGRKDDPLYKARRTRHTGADLLTERQHEPITALFAVQEHVEVEATWGIYPAHDRCLQARCDRSVAPYKINAIAQYRTAVLLEPGTKTDHLDLGGR